MRSPDVPGLTPSDPRFWDGAWLPGAKVVDLPTGHDPMVSEPAALVRLLLERAA